MNLFRTISDFYYDITLHELRLMNRNTLYPDITYNSLLYLDIIAYKKKTTVSELSGTLHVSKSAVTIKVNELVKQGLVEKVQSPDDRRVHYISVKPEVQKDYELYNRNLSNAVKALQDRYPEKDITLFCEMLGLVRTHYIQEP
ncbi:MarR family winged helix-turn-helix transcriptional regulator [Breznakiella homolactica]|uniref:MarR family transcriptional regulator n=1 Tax=Breznakiella homolactica TaxID=2798577 RepID=A0A7T8BA73_9SPIR|nr:helix-turn-helix domain-containing protein [Breznakiella homolactica]QQO09227.1 MarR family transcriptional regulator [Breznakiella homolactica]